MSIESFENKEVTRMKRVLLVSMLILGFCFLGVSAFAQLRGGVPDQLKGLKKAQHAKLQMAVVFATLPVKEQEKIIHLRKEYQQVLSQALKKRGEELKQIKEENPEEFEQIMQKAKHRVAKSLKEGHKKHPQKFEKLKRVRLEYLKESLGWLKEEDPKLYEELIEKIKEKRSKGQNYGEDEPDLDYEVIFNEDIPLAE